jgi:murein DD-endopeptidase MepM/ murein hydrolase activator NlpD
MERKFYTFLIFPGVHGKLRKIQLPFYAMHLMLGLSLVGLVTLGALANSYARMLLKVSNYNNVRDEREALKTQYRTLETVVSQTNAKLYSLQSLAAEVALTYGFGRARRPQFPHAMLSLATQSDSTLESTYHASLSVFNFMKTVALTPPLEGSSQSLVAGYGIDPSSVPAAWPVRGEITGGFGERMDPLSGEGEFHSGLDISARYGTEVAATGDGLVLAAERQSGYGNEILIDHGNGITTKYGHLSKIFVLVGQEVKVGEPIGAVGLTGRTTGPHLHYEVLIHNTPVNPAKYLRKSELASANQISSN